MKKKGGKCNESWGNKGKYLRWWQKWYEQEMKCWWKKKKKTGKAAKFSETQEE